MAHEKKGTLTQGSLLMHSPISSITPIRSNLLIYSPDRELTGDILLVIMKLS